MYKILTVVHFNETPTMIIAQHNAWSLRVTIRVFMLPDKVGMLWCIVGIKFLLKK